MEVMRSFYRENSTLFEGLPVILSSYPYTLKPIDGELVVHPERLFETVDHFKGVFDAAAIGQYLGGVDPIHIPNNSDGFVTPHSAFQVDKLFFKWKRVEEKWQPLMSTNQSDWYPIYNLHIHNKHMERWMSDAPNMKAHLPNVTVAV